MKKLFIILVSILMTITMYATVGIHVFNPAGGQTLYKGFTSDYMIKWTVSGDITKPVKIRLMDKKGEVKIYGITDSTSIASGQFLWRKDMINNTDIGDYVIRVKTIDNKYYDDSDVFHIRKKPVASLIRPKFTNKPIETIGIITQKINISEPVGNTSYLVGKPINIRWDKNFGNYTYVSLYFISINSPTSHVAIRGTSIKNTGVSSWTPQSNFNGSNIYVKIFTSDNKFFGKSGEFKLVYGPN